MRIKDIISISGMSGLYKTEVQKVNGVIVTSLQEGWTKFISNRQNLFSPLENVSIYTDNDTIPLSDVLLEVEKQKETNPPVSPQASNDEVRQWFLKIVPQHDQEKVYISDIKKLIKWYEILASKGVIADEIQGRLEENAPVKNTDVNEETNDVKSEGINTI